MNWTADEIEKSARFLSADHGTNTYGQQIAMLMAFAAERRLIEKPNEKIDAFYAQHYLSVHNYSALLALARTLAAALEQEQALCNDIFNDRERLRKENEKLKTEIAELKPLRGVLHMPSPPSNNRSET